MAVFKFKLFSGGISLLIFIYGLHTFLMSSEENRCEMTYMFENPQYINLPLESNLSHGFPQYRLLIYGEGRYADELRAGRLEGLPVLFMPGNGGSHRQVRSLASVALRMAQSLRSHKHFDFYAVDTNQELSALYGGVLWDQTLFLQSCVEHIVQLYAARGHDRKVTLIGHSMGGVISRALLTLPSFDVETIALIITLSSPHRFPVVALDWHTSRFYQSLKPGEGGWQRLPLLVTVAGGSRDVLVRSDLASLPPQLQQPGVSLGTDSIPGVWLSTDHLCILWCKQLVKSLVRVLFHLIHKKQYQISVDEAFQREVFEEEMIRGIASPPSLADADGASVQAPGPPALLPARVVQFSQAGQWLLKEEPTWRILKNKVLQAVNILVPLRLDEQIVVYAVGVNHLNWAFSCRVLNHTDICLEGKGLSSLAQAVPSPEGAAAQPGRLLFLAANDVRAKGHSHLLLYLVPSVQKVNLLGESYKKSVRHKIVILPSLLRSLLAFSPLRMLTVPLSEGALFYNVSLRGLELPWQAYAFQLETRVCRVGFSGGGLIRFHIPWSNEDQYYSVRSSLHARTELKGSLFHGRPIGSSALAQLHLLLAPECSYSLTVNVKIAQLSAQFLRFYLPLLPAYLAAALLAALSHQLHRLATRGQCPSLLSSLGNGQMLLALVLGPEILHYSFKWWGSWISFFPAVDDDILEDGRLHFPLLRFTLFCLTQGCLLGLVLATTAIFTLSGSALLWLQNRSGQAPLLNARRDAEVALDPRRTLLLFCCAALGWLCCGALALGLAACFLTAQLVPLCGQNCHEEQRQGPSAGSGRWHLQHTLLYLLATCLLLGLPSLGHWAGQPHWGLLQDPHKASAFVLLLSGAVLYQEGIPVASRSHYKLISVLVLVLSTVTCSFCLLQTWRVGHLLATCQALLAVQQLAARGKEKTP